MTLEAQFSIDLVGDLHLTKNDSFDLTGLQTSLYCAVTGNISTDLSVVERTLQHLGGIYRGVFYIDGGLEHANISGSFSRVEEITRICKGLANVIYLYNHVVIMNGLGFMAVNGWYNNNPHLRSLRDIIDADSLRDDEIAYLAKTVKSLQHKEEVKQIVMISASVPSDTLLYHTEQIQDRVEPILGLLADKEEKISHWLYGGTEIASDCTIGPRRFVNHPRVPGQPYYPKRIVL
jgi:hypothetical protein